MLTILLDGKKAAIKSGSSFELIKENSRFSKSDAYTLEITFPLKDCKENIAIFGMLFRKDCTSSKFVFRCEIFDKSLYVAGSAIITEFTDSEVKCQFLEGRAGANLTSPVADLYINEIEIAQPVQNASMISPQNAWSASRDCVALPWVNNDSGNMQNKIFFYNDTTINWYPTGISWMPYLSTVIKGICNYIGYSYDISQFENNDSLKYLLVCNPLPVAWGIRELARSLPHWTIEEFFNNLEDFLNAKFIIDHTTKKVTFVDSESAYENCCIVQIDSDVNDFTADVFINDSECKDIDVANISYASADHQMQKFYDCNWIIEDYRKRNMVNEFEDMAALVRYMKSQMSYINWSNDARLPNFRKIFYVKDIDAYYCPRCVWINPNNASNKLISLQNLNEFGERICQKDSSNQIELKFVPACIDYTDKDYGYTLFCSPSTFNESDESEESEVGTSVVEGDAVSVIEGGPSESSKAEYYDKIFIGWWDGNPQYPKQNPFPNVYSVCALDMDNVKYYDFNLNLAGKNSRISKFSRMVDDRVRYNIDFIAEDLPDVNSIFLIKGVKYVCEKLTAQISEQGMSSLVKGVFWRIKTSQD